ncbi:hypothetical protein F2Q69_00013817 [Brassica cretica]|uniref:Uncharacterized protein n=1 Tax=Brassica cretica TaxID=69181 RepID=A0A8S9QKX8_BRACR|nr:hypothetical protein F2Q69_00013817 [Brassica cretica]
MRMVRIVPWTERLGKTVGHVPKVTSCQRSRVTKGCELPKGVNNQRVQVAKRYEHQEVRGPRGTKGRRGACSKQCLLRQVVSDPYGSVYDLLSQDKFTVCLSQGKEVRWAIEPDFTGQSILDSIRLAGLDTVDRFILFMIIMTEELRIVLVKPRSRESSVSERLCNVLLDDARDELEIVYETVNNLCIGSHVSDAAPAALPKVRKRNCATSDAAKKRRCAKGGKGEPSSLGASGSSLMPQHRTKDLAEFQDKTSQLEAKLKVINDVHSLEVFGLETWISGLERDLGKTTSSLLKARQARRSKASKVRRIQRQIQNGEWSKSRGAEEAKDALRAKIQAYFAKITGSLDSFIGAQNRDLTLAGFKGGMSEIRLFMGEEVPSLRAVEAGGDDMVPSLDEVMGEGDVLTSGDV